MIANTLFRVKDDGDVLIGTASALDTSDPGTTITGPQIKPNIGSKTFSQFIEPKRRLELLLVIWRCNIV